MIILTGATSKVGSAVMRALAEDGVPARALVRSDAARAQVRDHRLDPVDVDIDRPETLAPAMAGGERLLLLTPPHPDQVAREKALVDAAVQAGVLHVVAVSMMGADRCSPVASGRWHAEVDEHIAGSGLQHTILRPAGFMQTHLWPVWTVPVDGTWHGISGDGAAAYVDADDVGAAAAGALRGAEGSSVVELTGPAALSMPQAAAVLASVLGRPVTYLELPPEQFRGGLKQAGVPDWQAEAILALYGVIRAGHATTVTDGVERLTGTPARSYRTFAEAHAAAFPAG